MKIFGLWIPLVTPMYHGNFDQESARRLIESLEPHADGYVVALSTGEGEGLSKGEWRAAVEKFATLTKRPVAVGVFLDDIEEIVERSKLAKVSECAAVVIPVPSDDENVVIDFFSALNAKSELPIIVYSEKHAIRNVETLRRLDKLTNIVAIKESSGNDGFIADLQKIKPSLRMAILQGMDHKLPASGGFDGFMVALSNVEPRLCRRMLENPTEETQKEILKKFWEYNLGGDWFVSLKALLYARGILRSAEQVRQTKLPYENTF